MHYLWLIYGVMTKKERQTRNLLYAGIITAILLMIVAGICLVVSTIKSWHDSDRLIDAQVKVYEAQADNIGKPRIIEQRYFSPQE